MLRVNGAIIAHSFSFVKCFFEKNRFFSKFFPIEIVRSFSRSRNTADYLGFLLQNEGTAVGAGNFGGMCLVGHHTDRLQSAEVLVRAVILALGHGTFDAGIRLIAASAFVAALVFGIGHRSCLLCMSYRFIVTRRRPVYASSFSLTFSP